MEPGRSGTIGDTQASLRLVDDRLHLDWRGSTFDLTTATVRHRDDGGRIRFSVTDRHGASATATYPRRGPTREELAFDLVDFTADEPWSWEDGDFGLFVFHVATGTGPVKYRHLLAPSDRSRAPRSTWPPVLDAGALTRRRFDARTESVHLGGLLEVRAKFELAGIWSDLTILTLDDGDGLAVVPVTVGKDATWVRDALLPELRSLPGWATAHDDRLERALEYASRKEIGPARGERAEDWAEWEVWAAEP